MQWAIVIAAFLAASVEFVEAFTLVLFWGHAKPSILVYTLYISVRIVFDERVSDTSK